MGHTVPWKASEEMLGILWNPLVRYLIHNSPIPSLFWDKLIVSHYNKLLHSSPRFSVWSLSFRFPDRSCVYISYFCFRSERHSNTHEANGKYCIKCYRFFLFLNRKCVLDQWAENVGPSQAVLADFRDFWQANPGYDVTWPLAFQFIRHSTLWYRL